MNADKPNNSSLDEVLALMRKEVDREKLRHNLTLTVDERLAKHREFVEIVQQMRASLRPRSTET
jgi:hypothetical protein